jgi:hypothetical protein
VGEFFHPIILWISIQPRSLSVKDGTKVARSCQEILVQSSIINVDVKIRKSLVTLLESPKLLMPTFSSDPTIDVHNPLTPTLGLLISGKLTPWTEGTDGFFIPEGGGSKRLAGNELAEVKEAMEALNIFYGDVSINHVLPILYEDQHLKRTKITIVGQSRTTRGSL